VNEAHYGFDAFDTRARHSLQRARDECERDGLAYIGTEQLFLGLLAQPGGVARRVLRNFGLELEEARTALRQLRPLSTEQPPPAASSGASDDIGLTPMGKRMLELAVDEARAVGQRFIGTEHLLLGLIALGQGSAIDMLHHRGLDLAAVRSRALQIARGHTARAGRRHTVASDSPLLNALRGSASVGSASVEGVEWSPAGRGQAKNNVVMCRVDDADMDAIDTLIEAGVRANRSDAASWLIKAGLESKRAVVDSVRDKVLEIRRIRDEARALAEDAEAQD
jgi:ATP-dependent Clp protease ATP-binding subunit ClpC